MAKNEFKPFATGADANVTSQADWEALPALSSGFQAGKASSAQVNKAVRQASFVASCLAQFVSEALNKDVLDDGNSASFITAIKQSIINGSVPAGVPVPWPSATPPSGWLKCNGAIFSTATYPLLAKAFPSGVLPDLRGEFIRGWDDGRGVDTGRQVLTAQASTWIQPNVETNNNATKIVLDNHDGYFNDGATGALGTFNASVNNSNGSRIRYYLRPRNVSFNYIVRAA